MMDVQKWLLERWKTGYFVEAGAHDGVGDSQTKRLEDAGWTGVCVEPSRAYYGLTLSRKCRTDDRALYSVDGMEMDFREMAGEAVELSGLDNYFKDEWDRDSRPHTVRRVETVSLTTLLLQHHAPGKIEFLSLDTEGSEAAILCAHDFRVFRPLVALVEYNGVRTSREALVGMFHERKYFFREDDGTNLLFTCNSLS